MAGELLTPPASWGDDARALPVDNLALSIYPYHPSPPTGRTWGDVQRDLQRGAWLVRDRASRYEVFRLGGEEFELRVTRRTGRDAAARGEEVWLAVIERAELARSVPPKAHRLRPASVWVERVHDEIGCDLAEIEKQVIEREQRVRGSASRFRGVARGSHGELQRAVRKEYGQLEALIELLAERAAQPQAEATGVVMATDQSRRSDTVTVNLNGGRLQDSARKRVRVTTTDGKEFYTQVTSTRGDRLELAEPRNWRVQPGDEVSVAVVPSFGMRQNADALRNFWSGDVEGSWDDLARLLCQPTTLAPLPDELPALTLYSDHDPDPQVPRLNDEQRKAVQGAVMSPHAFLIQGPPGTGKTEVISEIIRQLTGRGERVLLLAPSHVAVDEALHRVGRKPGVRPLRITFSDDKVRESLRIFLPENVGIETAASVLRPTDDGRQGRWEAEHQKVSDALQVVRDMADAQARQAAAGEALRLASAEAAEIAERLRARRADAEAETDRMARDADVAEQALNRAESALAVASAQERQLRELHQPPLTAIRDTATALVRDGEIAVRAHQAEQHAVAERAATLADTQARLAGAAAARAAAEALLARAGEAARSAQRQVTSLQGQLAAAGPPESMFGRFASRLGMGTYAELQRDLDAAQSALAKAQFTLQVRDSELQVALTTYEQLTAQNAAEYDRTESAMRMRVTAREDADRDYGRSWQAFVTAVTATLPYPPLPDSGDLFQQWDRLARFTHARIAEVLPPPPASARIEQTVNTGLPAEWEETWARPLRARLDALTDASTATWQAATARDEARQKRDAAAETLREAQSRDAAEIERLANESVAAQAVVNENRAAFESATQERDNLTATVQRLGYPDPVALERRHHVLGRLPALARRWQELTAERTDSQLADDIQQSLVRACNLVCATTKGIVGRGSDVVRHADYDTLIVDEASRVTESEFLIGAVRAQRWVLVGDEHQLPPHVETEDENFLHALTALHRAASGRSSSLEEAVKELGEVWKEDEELRKFRDESVRQVAEDLNSSGAWQDTFADRFAESHQRFAAGKGADTDRELLSAMIRYLVQSLFQRAVTRVDDSLRQPLVWQRRMVAPLAQIVNGPIYRGMYKSPSAEELAAAGVKPLVTPTFPVPCVFVDTSPYLDAEDTTQGHGYYNKREIALVTKVCEIYNEELGKGRSDGPVKTSVLAFYKAQAERLRDKLLAREDLPMLDWQVVDVIDRIQGQQSDLVIISFTRAKRGHFTARYGQWLMDTRRLNVACTRARRAVVLVGHADTLRRLGGPTADAQARQAREFYQNLFGLFESDEQNFLHRLRQL